MSNFLACEETGQFFTGFMDVPSGIIASAPEPSWDMA
jgi:hypothetical protein